MNITVNKLGKRFNRERIFKNFNFCFETGNPYAIVGPNGSGKSTLLQILWGQIPQSEGFIKYYDEGQEIPIEQVYQYVSIVAPYMELIEELTVMEMIQFHFQFKTMIHGYSKDDLVEKIGLSHAWGKQIVNLSSGMKQRLKLGLAFYSHTAMLFLDEPTTNLDKKSIQWYHASLKEIPASRLLLISSNQEHEYPTACKKINLIDLK